MRMEAKRRALDEIGARQCAADEKRKDGRRTAAAGRGGLPIDVGSVSPLADTGLRPPKGRQHPSYPHALAPDGSFPGNETPVNSWESFRPSVTHRRGSFHDRRAQSPDGTSTTLTPQPGLLSKKCAHE